MHHEIAQRRQGRFTRRHPDRIGQADGGAGKGGEESAQSAVQSLHVREYRGAGPIGVRKASRAYFGIREFVVPPVPGGIADGRDGIYAVRISGIGAAVGVQASRRGIGGGVHVPLRPPAHTDPVGTEGEHPRIDPAREGVPRKGRRGDRRSRPPGGHTGSLPEAHLEPRQRNERVRTVGFHRGLHPRRYVSKKFAGHFPNFAHAPPAGQDSAVHPPRDRFLRVVRRQIRFPGVSRSIERHPTRFGIDASHAGVDVPSRRGPSCAHGGQGAGDRIDQGIVRDARPIVRPLSAADLDAGAGRGHENYHQPQRTHRWSGRCQCGRRRRFRGGDRIRCHVLSSALRGEAGGRRLSRGEGSGVDVGPESARSVFVSAGEVSAVDSARIAVGSEIVGGIGVAVSEGGAEDRLRMRGVGGGGISNHIGIMPFEWWVGAE
mmetsp:Transcript_35247/g.105299  ORF Transcript_35247/g.105299 Transcript_35247/m.105299 type:complete len:432 (-) Transcript_35247:167-1462(-)